MDKLFSNMEKIESYFQIENGIVIGYHSDEIDNTLLPEGTKMVKANVENPDLLLGLDEKFIKENDREKIQEVSNNFFIETQKIPIKDSIKKRLKSLLIDIKLAEELDEDVTELRKQFNTLKKEYKSVHKEDSETKKESILKVNAGRTRTITLPNNESNLNGTIEPENENIQSVQWTKTKGGSAQIANPNNLSTTVTGLKKGVYEFTLSVTNDLGAEATDTVKITVKNEDPKEQ